MTHQTLLRIAPAIALVALASCGASKDGSSPRRSSRGKRHTHETRADEPTPSRTGSRSRPSTRATAPARPPLYAASEPPADTKSFALVIDDPDAPSGTFRHWGVFDIPSSARSIGGGERTGTEVSNDFGKPGYGGPARPRGTGRTIIISSCSPLMSAASASGLTRCEQPTSMSAKGELIGTYERR